MEAKTTETLITETLARLEETPEGPTRDMLNRELTRLELKYLDDQLDAAELAEFARFNGRIDY